MRGNSSKVQGVIDNFAASIVRLAPDAQLYFETPNGVEVPSTRRGRRYWVVSRGLCRFFKVPLLADAPRARQLDALSLEIKRLSPFEETGSHFHLGPNFASVWLWDLHGTRAAGQAIGIDVERLRILPEPALLANAENEVRLIETLDGVEAQCWVDGCLAASRWWPDPPDSRAWVLFQRGASVGPERLATTVPGAQHPGWLRRPWTKTRNTRSFYPSQLDLRLVAAGVAAFFLIGYVYEGAKWWRATSDLRALAGEITMRSNAIEPVLDARTQALDNLAAIRVLHGLDRFPGQLALMARVAEVLPQNQARLTAWTYDRGQLNLDIASSQPLDVVKLVRTLESIDHFKAVAAERTGSGNTLRLHVTVEPL
jgi:hypothetical protein